MELADIVIYPVKSLRGISVPRAAVEREGLAFDRRWMLVREDTGRFVSQREIPRMCTLRTELRPADAAALGTRRAAASRRGSALVVHPPPGSSLPPLNVPLEAKSSSAATTTASVWGFTGAAIDEGDEAAEWFSRALSDADPAAACGPLRASGGRVRLVRHAPDAPGGEREVDPEYAPGATVGFADGFPLLAANEGSLADLNARVSAGAAAAAAAAAAATATGTAATAPLTIEMARFRPNLVFRGGEATDAPWSDDGWARVRIVGGGNGGSSGNFGGSGGETNLGARDGSIELTYVKPCSRCKVTTVNQETGELAAGAQPLAALRAFRSGGALGWGGNRNEVYFAWNVVCVPPSTSAGAGAGGSNDEPLGVIETGSRVEVVERREWK